MRQRSVRGSRVVSVTSPRLARPYDASKPPDVSVQIREHPARIERRHAAEVERERDLDPVEEHPRIAR